VVKVTAWAHSIQISTHVRIDVSIQIGMPRAPAHRPGPTRRGVAKPHTQQADRKVLVRSPSLRKQPPTMSPSSPSDVSPPQHLSVVGAFKAAPTLVKVLAASFYLPALLLLVESVRLALFFGPEPDGNAVHVIYSIVYVLVGLVLALVGFLLGKGIARGARGTWVLALVLTVIALLACLQSLVGSVTVFAILNAIVMVALLGLLLTPVVRRHCTKK
jgi:hypothetical protein